MWPCVYVCVPMAGTIPSTAEPRRPRVRLTTAAPPCDSPCVGAAVASRSAVVRVVHVGHGDIVIVVVPLCKPGVERYHCPTVAVAHH